MKIKKNIIVSPLNWGLGHASRLIPIIYELINRSHNIIIVGSGASFDLLQSEFPELSFIRLRSFSIKYSKSKSQIALLFFQIPKFIYYNIYEYYKIQTIVEKQNIDFIISDNRYGLRSKKCKSAIITHQLHINIPNRIKFLEPLINKLNTKLINKFDFCLVPDIDSVNNYAGILSINNKIKNKIYIGLLSKFKRVPSSEIKYKFTAILSGPEPQRTIFEEIITKEFEKSDYNTCIVKGTKEKSITKTQKIKIFNILNSKELREVINQSEFLITRSGYSSIMDIICLGKSAIISPTPGQTEQEYLALYYKENKWILSFNQYDFDLNNIFCEVNNYKLPESEIILSAKIDEIL